MVATLVRGFNGRFFAVSEEGKIMGKSHNPFSIILNLKELGVEDFHVVPFSRIASDPMLAEVKELETEN